jgi:hypothetical protein
MLDYSKDTMSVEFKLDVHGSVHHSTNLAKMTKNMQLCRTIYYSIVS